MLFGTRRRQVRRSDEAGFPTMPPGGGLVSSRVIDQRGRPLHGAEVSVFDAVGRRVLLAESDPYGSFVAAVPPGNYRVVVLADGYQGFRGNAEVESGRHTSLGQLTLFPSQNALLPPVGVWKIDPEHSAVRFIGRHIALSRIHGRFNEFAGTIWVADPMEDSVVEVTIEAGSIDTNNVQRDDHLRSVDFLDVVNFPQLHFTSNRFIYRGGSRWVIQGALSLHGVTRSVQLDTHYLGTGPDQYDGIRTSCTAITELHREDFTLNWRKMFSRGIAIVGATVQIELDIQAVFQE